MSAEPASEAPGGARLVRPTLSVATPPALDPAQRRVVEHDDGPLLVFGGPGTGKTTTLVEAVAARGAPDRVLVLTFGRRMAARLRRSLAARLAVGAGPVTFQAEPLVRTFHGYAFGLLRRAAVAAGEPEPRLLSGPEQDLTIRELIGTGLADRRYDAGWPDQLRAALRTRGFAGELRDLLARAAERGIGAARLADWGAALGRDDWLAAARFATGYADVLALRDAAGHDTVAYDPAELIRAAIGALLDDPALLAAERDSFRYCYVDELHDTDPAQLELLELLAGDGRHLVAFGDPDSSTFAFRGADPAAVAGFPDRFGPGRPAPTVTLWTGWRQSRPVLAATRRVAARLPGPPRHRALRPADPDADDGRVRVRLFRSGTQEAAYLAHALREAHLLRGMPWSAMAVVVRSTVRQLAGLRRALTAAGVPVRVEAEDLPLGAQPAVAPLLSVLRCALVPDALDEAAAVGLLHSPLGGADPFTERQLRQGLRALALPAGDRRPSGVLLLEALRRPVELAAVDRRWAAPAVRVAELLAAARRTAATPGATAVDVLWAVWSGSGLAERWSRLSARGGQRGAAADRDLDAVLALFDAAARFTDRMPGAGPVVFCEHVAGQQLPADSLAPTAQRGDAVRILTAHSAKGQEWDLVAVPGVQEGSWPDLRPRGSLLGSELLVDLVAGRQPDPASAEPPAPAEVGAAAGRAALLEEERRLFYVAVTRARRELLVSAVAAGDGEELPSRFVTELAGTPELPDPAPPPRALTLPALVAELRTVVGDVTAEPGRRRAAARQLARLAAARVTGAHPASWWGMGALSDERELAGPGERVEVSPSTLEHVRRCGVRWMLERHGGASPPGVEQSVGTLVHAAAAEASDLSALRKYLDAHWDEVEFPARWVVERKRAEADKMLDKLADWLAGNPRELVATEHRFRTRLPAAPDGPAVELSGAVDRLEVDEDGRPFIVDLKTGASAPSDAAAAEHPQLAAYQVAAANDAFAGLTPASAEGSASAGLTAASAEGSASAGLTPASTEGSASAGLTPASTEGSASAGPTRASEGLGAAAEDGVVSAGSAAKGAAGAAADFGDGAANGLPMVRPGAEPAGAALVQLGGTRSRAKEQRQPALADADDPSWARDMVHDAARRMAAATFTAVVNEHCRSCAVATSCPLSPHGRQVTQP